MSSRSRSHYRWIVVALAFLSTTTYGLFSSFSVFLTPLEADLHTSRAAISGVYTVYVVVYSLFGMGMGWLCDRCGPRRVLWLAACLIGVGVSLCRYATALWQLYLLFGVVAAIGHGAIFVVPTSTVSRWFVQRRGLAVGLAASGVGFGLLVVPPIAVQLNSAYGWQASLFVLGIAFFAINAISGTFMRTPSNSETPQPTYGTSSVPHDKPSALNDASTAQAIKSTPFWMLYLTSVLRFATEQMVLVHMVAYGATQGIAAPEAALGISSLGVGTILGRVVAGAISDRIGRVPTLVMCSVAQAAATFFLLGAGNLPALYSTMLVLGFGYGGGVVLGPVILADYYGVRNFGTIMGVYFTAGVPAAFLGPLMAGVVFDISQSYFMAIVIAGVICTGAIFTSIMVKRTGQPRQM